MLSKIDILGSSSSGNGYILYFDNGKVIQLDAGIKNPNFDKVDLLFISHHHIDHDKFQKDFEENKVIDINSKTTPLDHLIYERIHLPHIVENYAYIIKYDGSTIGYFTDCGNIEQVNVDLRDLDYLFIECNWDYFLIKNGVISKFSHGEYSFGKEGHLSNLDCLNALAKWNVGKDCKIILIHKSSFHCNWDSSYKMFESLPNKKYIAKKGETLYCKSWKVI